MLRMAIIWIRMAGALTFLSWRFFIPQRLYMRITMLIRLIFIACAFALLACDSKVVAPESDNALHQNAPAERRQVNVYSARKEALIFPVLKQFTEETGVVVNLLTGDADALISRIANEGELGSADILITTDIGRLVRAKQQGLTKAIDSEVLSQHIPAHLRDPAGHWFALTTRARPIMYSTANVKAEELDDLEDLAAENWRGKVCVRSSSNIYNQSLIAALIIQQGEDFSLEFAKGLVANLARPPKGGDKDQIKAVAAGQCDIAIANTYYLAGMLASKDASQVAAAERVKVFWPNQSNRGAHINISGAVITRHAPNPVAAKELLEFMLGKEAQAWYAAHNHEYPVRKGVEPSEILRSFGTFKAEQINLEKVGELNGAALQLMDRAGWK